MNFYSILKWCLTGVFIGIIIIAITSTPDDKKVVSKVVPNQQSQSKFNF